MTAEAGGATFTFDQTTVNFRAVEGSRSRPATQTRRGSVSGADSQIFIFVVLESNQLIEDASVFINGTTGELDLRPQNTESSAAGVYRETVEVRVCTDESCNSQINGSPKRLQVVYTVDPDPFINDADGDNVVDAEDAFPNDASESSDFDNDNIGDNADPDDDNDGTPDNQDSAPRDSRISTATTTLRFTIEGRGSIRVDGQDIDCDGSCEVVVNNAVEFSSHEIVATAGVRFGFASYSRSDLCSPPTNARCEFESPHSKSEDITVRFQEDPFMTLIGQFNGNDAFTTETGDVQCSDNCSIKVYDNGEATFELFAVPSSGHQFVNWGQACSGAAQCSFAFNANTTVNVTANFSDTGMRFDSCPGSAGQTFTGQAANMLNLFQSGPFVSLCNGFVLLSGADNVTLRDVINDVTVNTFQTGVLANQMVLDEAGGFLYIIDDQAGNLIRLDLATGEVVDVVTPAGYSVDSVAVSAAGEVFVRTEFTDGSAENEVDSFYILDSQSATFVWHEDERVEFLGLGGSLSFNDQTSRLITSINNYKYTPGIGAKGFVLEGPSNPGGFSDANCVGVKVASNGDDAMIVCSNDPRSTDGLIHFSSNDPTVQYGESDLAGFNSAFAADISTDDSFVVISNGPSARLFDMNSHQLLDIVGSPCGDEFDGFAQNAQISSDDKLTLVMYDCFNGDTQLQWFSNSGL